jgi:hypothetical protein
MLLQQFAHQLPAHFFKLAFDLTVGHRVDLLAAKPPDNILKLLSGTTFRTLFEQLLGIFLFPHGTMKTLELTFKACKNSNWIAFKGFTNCLRLPAFATNMPRNFVVIINYVGRIVGRAFQPPILLLIFVIC